MKIISFSQQGPRAICILSANGAISNVTLRQPDSSGGTLTYEISTIIIHLDLDCCTCHEKITKILCKFHCIQTKTIDYKQKTLTISGPFDPDRLMKCLSCKAGKYIKSYEIVKEKPQPPKDQQQKKKNDGEVDKPDKQQKKKQDGEVTKPDQPKPIQVVVPIQLYVPVPKPIPVPAVLWPFYGRPCCDGHREGPCRWLREPTKPLIELVEDSDPAPPLALPPPEAKPTRPASPPPTKPAGTRPVCCRPCNEGYNDGPCRTGHWPQENFQPGRRTCCTSCYEGYGGGPCWQGEPSGPTSICYKSQYQGTDTGVQVVNEEDPSCNIM